MVFTDTEIGGLINKPVDSFVTVAEAVEELNCIKDMR